MKCKSLPIVWTVRPSHQPSNTAMPQVPSDNDNDNDNGNGNDNSLNQISRIVPDQV